jgi:hypothetical protein
MKPLRPLNRAQRRRRSKLQRVAEKKKTRLLGRPAGRLPDTILLSPIVKHYIKERLRFEGEQEDGNGTVFAVIQKADGGWIESGTQLAPPLIPEQTMFARDMVQILNREIHHNGCWLVFFTHPERADGFVPGGFETEYPRFGFIWLDQDGDPQFTMDWLNGEYEELTFQDVLMSGPVSWAQRLETAWHEWHTAMVEVIEPAQGQTFKRAQGQAPSNSPL